MEGNLVKLRGYPSFGVRGQEYKGFWVFWGKEEFVPREGLLPLDLTNPWFIFSSRWGLCEQGVKVGFSQFPTISLKEKMECLEFILQDQQLLKQ